MSIARFLPSFLLSALLIFGLAFNGLAADTKRYPSSTLAGQLQAIGKQDGFSIRGLEKLEGEEKRKPRASGIKRLKNLLNGFDYVMVHKGPNRLERLIIIGRKGEAPPPVVNTDVSSGENVLETRRMGAHHLVKVQLNGEASFSMDQELMLDTGASLIALPESLHAGLGIDLKQAQTRTLQTAKGKLEAKVSTLSSVRIGNASVDNVEAAFVDDNLLGNHGLLGMNVLSRFVFILDDDNNKLTLIPDSPSEE